MALKELFQQVAPSLFRPRNDEFIVVERLPQYHAKWYVGRCTYGKIQLLSWGEDAALKIGSFCSFADGIKIFLGGEHRVDWVTTFPFNRLWPEARAIDGHPTTRGDVAIGNDVWVAEGVMIMSGVHIGDGAVVASGSVVTKSVPPYTIVAGNPAREVRKRFDDNVIARLIQVAWWNWPDERIRERMPLLLSDDIYTFLKVAEA